MEKLHFSPSLCSEAACVFSPQAHAGERILTLQELAQQPVNQHKPIIVINTSPGFVFPNTRTYSFSTALFLLLHLQEAVSQFPLAGNQHSHTWVLAKTRAVSFISIHNVLFEGPLSFRLLLTIPLPLSRPILSLSFPPFFPLAFSVPHSAGLAG